MQAEYRSSQAVVRKGMIQSFVAIFREEGVRGLYRVCKFVHDHNLVDNKENVN